MTTKPQTVAEVPALSEALEAARRDDEDWRPAPGWEGAYEVSSLGRVRKVGGRLISRFLNDKGYWAVRLSNPRRDVRVHRLVALAFLANPHNLPEVNHMDGVKTNPVFTNLEWCTPKHNRIHATRLRLLKATKLTDGQAIEVRARHRAGESQRALGRWYGVDKNSIRGIVRGHTYAWTLPSPPKE